jgi:putative aldouronate transport system substrate-binding protein
MDSKILNSAVGATIGYAGGTLGKYMTSAKQLGLEAFELYPAPFPVLKKGDSPKFGSKDFKVNLNMNGYITTACKNIELAMRFLDYGYSEKGRLLFNFGQEGVSYTMEDGYPKVTELVTNNPDGMTFSQVAAIYCCAAGPFVGDARYLEQYYVQPQQKAVFSVWGQTDDSAIVPTKFLSMEAEELTSSNKALNSVKTYSEEYLLKFIMGLEPLDNYGAFVDAVKSYGLNDDLLQVYKRAFERFNNR